jgi:uncharacterized membrane protein YfcA
LEYFGYVSAIFIGLLLGLLGGGGSILSIPILVYLFQLDAVTASGYSLFIVGTTSFAGAIPKYRDHLVNIKTGFLFASPLSLPFSSLENSSFLQFQICFFSLAISLLPKGFCCWVCLPF